MAHILLDECVPVRLQDVFAGHQVSAVRAQQWRGLRNGRLLQRAQEEFDVFVTVDKRMRFQQNMSRFDISLLVLIGRTNTLAGLVPVAELSLPLLDSLKPGTVTVIEGSKP